MQIVSNGDNLHEMSKLFFFFFFFIGDNLYEMSKPVFFLFFFFEKLEKYFKISSADIFTQGDKR